MALQISKTSSSLTLYLNRYTELERNVYDQIRIRRDGMDFVVLYTADVKETEKNKGGTETSFETSDTQGLLSYLDHLLRLVVQDQAPFVTVDVLIPCFPSVKFRHGKLEEVIPLVLNCIRMWM
jgi:hypothetical protein